jgi:hypothetical protein
MNSNMSIYEFHRPTGTHLEPPKSSKPIIASSFEIDPEYIEFVQNQPFSGEGEENPYTHLREFKAKQHLPKIERSAGQLYVARGNLDTLASVNLPDTLIDLPTELNDLERMAQQATPAWSVSSSPAAWSAPPRPPGPTH